MVEKIGLIAGGGQFPLIFARRARQKGYRVYAAGYRKETDPGLKELVENLEWFHLGQISKLIKYFKDHHVSRAVMMGTIGKVRMFSDLKPDMKAIAMVARMRHTHDDNVLRAFADTLEKAGIRIKPSTFLLPEMLAPAGCWTRRKPSRAEKKDIRFGWKIAKEIGRLDIGQCIVAAGGTVLAVEAIDGTDSTIERGGRLGKGQAVVIKICKPNQDFRFDVPAVGPGTIETMAAAGAKVLAVEAGKAVVFDREEMIAKADEASIAIIAVDDTAFERGSI